MSTALLPRIHLVLEESVAEALPFQEICMRESCPNKGVKTCPKVLVVNKEPILNYKKFFSVFSGRNNLLNLCFSHLTFTEDKEDPLEYLVYFTEKCGFHEKASKIIQKTACFHPAYSPQNT